MSYALSGDAKRIHCVQVFHKGMFSHDRALIEYSVLNVACVWFLPFISLPYLYDVMPVGRYFHKGVFYQDGELIEKSMLDRDFNAAVGVDSDIVDKAMLPKVLQVQIFL